MFQPKKNKSKKIGCIFGIDPSIIQAMLSNVSRLRIKFLIIVLPPIIICMVLYSLIFSLMTYRDMHDDLQNKLDTMAQIQQVTLAQPVWSYNQNMIDRIVQTMVLDEDVRGIRVTDSFNTTLTSKGELPDPGMKSDLERTVNIVYSAVEQDNVIGSLTILVGDERIWAAIYSQVLRDVLLITLVVVTVILSALIANMIIIDHPLAVFLKAIVNNKENNLRSTMKWQAGDELGQVIKAYNEMVQILWQREDDLSYSQIQLQAVTDNIPGAVVQIIRGAGSNKYTVDFVSQGIQDLLGTRPTVLVDDLQRWSMHIATTDMNHLISHLDQSANELKPATVEIPMTTVEGHHIWAHFMCRPRVTDTGAVIWDSLLLDVTEKHVLENRLRELATTDGLTGLNNRRNYMDLARNEILRCRRHELSTTVAVVDCDHFKKVNDNYGHVVGDFVLKEFARLVTEILREIDIVGRLGGEEFAITFVNTDIEGARIVANRLCQRIADHLMDHSGFQFHHTISIGLAELKSYDEDISSLLKRADKALYHAKKTGRNRVVADIDIPEDEEYEVINPVITANKTTRF